MYMDRQQPTEDATQVFTAPEQAAGLRDRVLDEERVRPILALTSERNNGKVAIDLGEFEAEILERCEIWHLTDTRLTWEMRNLLFDHKGIPVPFGGWGLIWWPASQGGGRVRYGRQISPKPHDPSSIATQISEDLRRGVPGPDGAKVRRDLSRARQENRVLKEKLSISGRVERELRVTIARLERQTTEPDTESEDFVSEVAAYWSRELMQAGRSLESFSIGSEFEESISRTEVVSRKKVIEVTARLAGGLRDTIDCHPFRTGQGGNDPQRERADGALAYRCYLKRNTPSAARLHFWRLPDGSLELWFVGVHDDTPKGG